MSNPPARPDFLDESLAELLWRNFSKKSEHKLDKEQLSKLRTLRSSVSPEQWEICTTYGRSLERYHRKKSVYNSNSVDNAISSAQEVVGTVDASKQIVNMQEIHHSPVSISSSKAEIHKMSLNTSLDSDLSGLESSRMEIAPKEKIKVTGPAPSISSNAGYASSNFFTGPLYVSIPFPSSKINIDVQRNGYKSFYSRWISVSSSSIRVWENATAYHSFTEGHSNSSPLVKIDITGLTFHRGCPSDVLEISQVTCPTEYTFSLMNRGLTQDDAHRCVAMFCAPSPAALLEWEQVIQDAIMNNENSGTDKSRQLAVSPPRVPNSITTSSPTFMVSPETPANVKTAGNRVETSAFNAISSLRLDMDDEDSEISPTEEPNRNMSLVSDISNATGSVDHINTSMNRPSNIVVTPTSLVDPDQPVNASTMHNIFVSNNARTGVSAFPSAPVAATAVQSAPPVQYPSSFPSASTTLPVPSSGQFAQRTHTEEAVGLISVSSPEKDAFETSKSVSNFPSISSVPSYNNISNSYISNNASVVNAPRSSIAIGIETYDADSGHQEHISRENIASKVIISRDSHPPVEKTVEVRKPTVQSKEVSARLMGVTEARKSYLGAKKREEEERLERLEKLQEEERQSQQYSRRSSRSSYGHGSTSAMPRAPSFRDFPASKKSPNEIQLQNAPPTVIRGGTTVEPAPVSPPLSSRPAFTNVHLPERRSLSLIDRVNKVTATAQRKRTTSNYKPHRSDEYHRFLGVPAPSMSRMSFQYHTGYERPGWHESALGSVPSSSSHASQRSNSVASASHSNANDALESHFAVVNDFGVPLQSGVRISSNSQRYPVELDANIASPHNQTFTSAYTHSSSASSGSGRVLSPGVRRRVVWGGQSWVLPSSTQHNRSLNVSSASQEHSANNTSFNHNNTTSFSNNNKGNTSQLNPDDPLTDLLLDHINQVEERLRASEAERAALTQLAVNSSILLSALPTNIGENDSSSRNSSAKTSPKQQALGSLGGNHVELAPASGLVSRVVQDPTEVSQRLTNVAAVARSIIGTFSPSVQDSTLISSTGAAAAPLVTPTASTGTHTSSSTGDSWRSALAESLKSLETTTSGLMRKALDHANISVLGSAGHSDAQPPTAESSFNVSLNLSGRESAWKDDSTISSSLNVSSEAQIPAEYSLDSSFAKNEADVNEHPSLNSSFQKADFTTSIPTPHSNTSTLIPSSPPASKSPSPRSPGSLTSEHSLKAISEPPVPSFHSIESEESKSVELSKQAEPLQLRNRTGAPRLQLWLSLSSEAARAAAIARVDNTYVLRVVTSTVDSETDSVTERFQRLKSVSLTLPPSLRHGFNDALAFHSVFPREKLIAKFHEWIIAQPFQDAWNAAPGARVPTMAFILTYPTQNQANLVPKDQEERLRYLSQLLQPLLDATAALALDDTAAVAFTCRAALLSPATSTELRVSDVLLPQEKRRAVGASEPTLIFPSNSTERASIAGLVGVRVQSSAEAQRLANIVVVRAKRSLKNETDGTPTMLLFADIEKNNRPVARVIMGVVEAPQAAAAAQMLLDGDTHEMDQISLRIGRLLTPAQNIDLLTIISMLE